MDAPEGGFFVWVTLPPYVDTGSMLSVALENGVTYTPGDGFYPGGSDGKNSMRIAFCFESPENLTEAIKRLAAVINDRLELYRAFIEAGAIKVPTACQPSDRVDATASRSTQSSRDDEGSRT